VSGSAMPSVPQSARSKPPSPEARASALASLLLAAATLALAIDIVIDQFPRGLIILGCIGLALAAGWYGLLRRGSVRLLGLGLAGLALASC
jgi:hypothetical protein